jgi:hypothetical protein
VTLQLDLTTGRFSLLLVKANTTISQARKTRLCQTESREIETRAEQECKRKKEKQQQNNHYGTLLYRRSLHPVLGHSATVYFGLAMGASKAGRVRPFAAVMV